VGIKEHSHKKQKKVPFDQLQKDQKDELPLQPLNPKKYVFAMDE
jgi:hypothetical protein